MIYNKKNYFLKNTYVTISNSKIMNLLYKLLIKYKYYNFVDFYKVK